MDGSSQKQSNVNDVAKASAASVSTPNKEVEVAPPSDYLASSAEIESIIKDKEVKDAGVTEVSSAPSLDQSHFKVGMRHAGSTVPFPTNLTGMVSLSMSEGEAHAAAKGNINNSKTWLASFILRFLKKMRAGNAVS